MRIPPTCGSAKHRGIIAVRESARREQERERFTIAHEIGHYLLPGHDTANSIREKDQVGLAVKDKGSFEQAANQFAGELLLPSGAVRRLVRKLGISVITYLTHPPFCCSLFPS